MTSDDAAFAGETAIDARRPMPEVSPWTAPFWTGGKDGELRLPHCKKSGHFLHPSQRVCQHCHSHDLEWVAISGTAVVIGVTVNHQMFMPSFDPPYLIAVVAFDDAPEVRFTTNLVGVPEGTEHIGQRVRVVFHEQDGVWFPLFTPSGEPDGDGTALAPPPVVTTRPPVSSERFEHKVAITGMGFSEIGRRLMRPPVTLTVDACEAAIADAGLTFADIDGLATWPGAMGNAGGITEGGIAVVEEALGIHPTWHAGGIEVSGQTGSVVNAMLAVASGLCRHVLCFRTVWEATHTELLRTGGLPLPSGGKVGGDFQWRIPFGSASASNWIGMQASQYFAKYGGDREMLGWIALNARKNAALNPRAVYRDPMTMDDYMAARMVSTPLGLFDCDVPCDGAVALIISARETAKDLRQPPVFVDAVGTQATERNSWDQGTMTHLPNVFGPAAHVWSRSSLTHADIDVAEIYDGFSFNCVTWLEGLGFCGVGEAKDFLEGGKRIALDGELPVNTHGGQLSGGRTHGYGFVAEAMAQLRGAAGERQVPDAEVALVAVGGGMPGGAFVLTR